MTQAATNCSPPGQDLFKGLDEQALNDQLDWVKTRTFLGSDAAFMAPIMSELEYCWAPVGSAATDGVHFFWDPKDFVRCTPNDRVATVVHELHHVGRLHILRGKGKEPGPWNIACDIVINRDLRKDGYILETEELWIGDHPEIPFETEEDIYDYLIANKPPFAQNAPTHFGGNIPGAPEVGPTGAPVGQTSDMKQINTVITAIQAAKIAGDPGSIPGNVEQVVKAFLKPIINWEAELQRFCTDLLDEEYTMARPERRYLHMDIYLPSLEEDEGRLEHLSWYYDVSGSVTDEELLRYNSEARYVFETLKPKKMTIVLFDTRITKVIEIKEGDEFKEIKVVGRGGTDLAPVRAHIEETKPTAAIILSDLFVSPMKKLSRPIPVLWVSTSNVVGAFGRTIHIRGNSVTGTSQADDPNLVPVTVPLEA